MAVASTQRETRIAALANALVALQRQMPQPDLALEDAALAAIEDAESLEEGWESVLARGLVPEGWMDTSRRRFYGVSNRCARCGHPDRCPYVLCLNDERREVLYAHEPFPSSWWDVLVLVGHRERIVAAEQLALEFDARLPSVMASVERAGISLVIEPPINSPLALSRPQRAIYAQARERAEQALGLPLSAEVQAAVLSLFKQLNTLRGDDIRITVDAPYRAIANTGVVFGGQTYGWTELRCPFTPSADAARRMPRARPMRVTR